MRLKLLFMSTMLLLLTTFIDAQKKEPNWVRVQYDYSSRMYVDINNIQNLGKDDMYVWTMEENFPPVTIESVRGKIYATKTYFLFNKKLKKYSFLEKIYYDEKNNVLNSFSYKRETGLASYQYNYPIIEGSIEDSILAKCLEYTGEKE